MTAYKINPPGVQSVLLATLTPAEALHTDLAPLQGSVEQAGEGCGGSAEIVSALNDLMTAEGTRIGGMAGRVEACLTAAAKATNLYVHADGQMAEHIRKTQAQALTFTRALPR